MIDYLSQLADSGKAALKDGWPTPKPIGIASSSSSPFDDFVRMRCRRRAGSTSGYRISRAVGGLGRPEFAPKPFVPIRYDPDDQAPFSPLSALCGGLGICPGPKRCYERANDDRATYKEGVRAAYKCADGPPGSKWNLAADTPPSKRVARRAYKRAREELKMLEREAQPSKIN